MQWEESGLAKGRRMFIELPSNTWAAQFDGDVRSHKMGRSYFLSYIKQVIIFHSKPNIYQFFESLSIDHQFKHEDPFINFVSLWKAGIGPAIVTWPKMNHKSKTVSGDKEGIM